MIDDLPVRWAVTVLFVFAAVECIYTVVRRRPTPIGLVSQALHITMAMAMVAMAWPGGSALPTTGPLLFFVAATAWFIVVAGVRSGHRGLNLYHGAMMAAMAWMYAVMSGDLAPAPAQGLGESTYGGDHASMPGMPGMVMPGVDSHHAAGPPPFVVGLNTLCVIGFAIAAVWWLLRLVTQARTEPDPSKRRWAGTAAQAMMAAGTAVMFGQMV